MLNSLGHYCIILEIKWDGMDYVCFFHTVLATDPSNQILSERKLFFGAPTVMG